MIECLKRIVREDQSLEPPCGLLPRRFAIGCLPGKVSVVTGVRGGGKGLESNGPQSTKQRLTIQKAFEDYWQLGGFPGANRLAQQQHIEAHQANWNSIVASIIGHHDISHPGR